ncbi:PREDICTED: uncharacterized protein LOC104817909 [Tarenaya hassleriana]|uniref:uncharacterized protein LOC104817909 n=1 Tax=Tarenaya hassleriana TaxID=28532 RepID=UPI00053C45F1|nr:PREDICTED: uncharacterized protein LOC104817909 [Tarenaya hassleriana]
MASSRKPNKGKKPKPRTHVKKQLRQHKNTASLEQTSPCRASSTATSSCLSSTSASPFTNPDDNSPPSPGGDGCRTPKARKFRIPEMLTCPPAPKKRRAVPNCSLRRRPIAFYAPPDIELFFVFACGEQVN